MKARPVFLCILLFLATAIAMADQSSKPSSVIRVLSLKEITISADEMKEIIALEKASILVRPDGYEEETEYDTLSIRLKNGEALNCFVGRLNDKSQKIDRPSVFCIYRGFVLAPWDVRLALHDLEYPNKIETVHYSHYTRYECTEKDCTFTQATAIPKAIVISVTGSGPAVNNGDVKNVMAVIGSRLVFLRQYLVMGLGDEGGKVVCIEFEQNALEANYDKTLTELQSLVIDKRRTERSIMQARHCTEDYRSDDLKPYPFLRFPDLETKSRTTLAKRIAEKNEQMKVRDGETQRIGYLNQKLKQLVRMYLAKMGAVENDLTDPIFTGQVNGQGVWAGMSSPLNFKNGRYCEFTSPGLNVQTDRAGGEITLAFPEDLNCYNSVPKTLEAKPFLIIKGSNIQVPFKVCPKGHQGRLLSGFSHEGYCWQK